MDEFEHSVLIADDDAQVARVLDRILTGDGYDCAIAHSVREARALLTERAFDVALVDILMGAESGLDLARELSEHHPETATLILTVVDDREIGRAALALGVFGYLIKPFTSNEILINVANALRHRELAIENRQHREELERLVAERTSDLEATIRSLETSKADLAEAEARYRGIFENALAGVFRADADGRLELANRAMAQMLGRATPEDLVREVTLADLLVDPIEFEHLATRLAQDGAVHGYEAPLRHRSGRDVVASIALRAVPGADGSTQAVEGLAIDATARIRAQEALQRTLDALRSTDRHRRELLGRLVDAQEAERKRIAEDIHDDIVQVMTAIGIRLYTLRKSMEEPGGSQLIDQLEVLVRDAIGRLRTFIFELTPPSLNELGLEAALRDHLEALAKTEGLRHELDVRLEDEPPLAARVILYRITQEALANVRKHANASQVRLSLCTDGAGYQVSVADSGIGFEAGPDTLSPPGHIGLSTMRDRAEMAGGWLRVRSEPGRGTTLTFWVPGEVDLAESISS